jgi:hypothetical protein
MFTPGVAWAIFCGAAIVTTVEAAINTGTEANKSNQFNLWVLEREEDLSEFM